MEFLCILFYGGALNTQRFFTNPQVIPPSNNPPKYLPYKMRVNDAQYHALIRSFCCSSDFGLPTLECSFHCNCPEKAYNPICGSDGIEYISPCHAGCEVVNIDNNSVLVSYSHRAKATGRELPDTQPLRTLRCPSPSTASPQLGFCTRVPAAKSPLLSRSLSGLLAQLTQGPSAFPSP